MKRSLVKAIALALTALYNIGCGPAADENRLSIVSVRQQDNYLVCSLDGIGAEETNLANLVQSIVVSNTTTKLEFDGNHIYPCPENEGRVALLFLSKNRRYFLDTTINISFHLDDLKEHEKAKCGGLRSSTADNDNGSLFDESTARICPEPSDIIIEPDYTNCEFSVALKSPYDKMSFSVLLDGERVDANRINMRPLKRWNVVVKINEDRCNAGELEYYRNGDIVSTSRCPREYDAAEANEIKNLLKSWLADPSNRSKMDQCGNKLTSVFGDDGYTIMLGDTKLETYAGLREHIDNETLNNPDVTFELLDYGIDEKEYRLTSLKVKRR